MKITKGIWVFGLLLTAMLLSMDTDAQCAMCKASLEAASKEVDMNIGEQVNSGILYLMVIPYLVFFIFFRKKIRTLLRELKNAARH
ncbi:MAG: hypothetical protein ACHQF2_01385 [Flavobacteriales bacterium]